MNLNLKRIGGSDAAAILGLSDYGTALDVYLRIVENFHAEPSKAMRTGKKFERVIADLWAETKGVEVRWFETSIEVPGREWQRVSPDLEVVGVSDLRDVKKIGAYVQRHGTPGTDQIEDYEAIQLQTYFEAFDFMGRPFDTGGLIAFDMAAEEANDYIMAPDAELGAMIVDACQKFWTDNVLAKKRPELQRQPSRSVNDYLRRVYPTEVRTVRPATDDEVRLALRLREIDVMEDEAKAIKQELQLRIGDAAGIEGPFGTITYKKNKDSSSCDWQAVATELAGKLGLHGVDPEIEAVKQRHSASRQGPRVFRPKWKKTG